ncbi:MAG: cytochrome oxidase Cu insertion factor (SCO1/SenC/PrrC family) [Polaribacter sp.]|jgi:cytochrome oxidase Cu insertion factor (SCO1/SenC/PrrC family)
MADLQAIPSVSNLKRVIQFAVLFILLIVLPLGTVFYTNGGNDSFKVMIGELHDYGEIPNFEFATHNGGTLTNDKLKSKVVVNAFFSLENKEKDFLALQLTKLHSIFNDNDEVLFLLYSLSPESDNIEELKAFAEKSGLTDEEQFFLLRGSQQTIADHFAAGFKWPSNFDTREKNTALEFGAIPPGLKTYPYLVIADKTSMIRNYYDYKDNKAMGRLVEHMALLLPSRVDDDPELRREQEK